MEYQTFDDYTKIHSYLDDIVTTHQNNIKDWIVTHYHNKNKPFYGSVDIRNSGFKVAPVDTNLFPAGFNNLNLSARKKAQIEIAKYFATTQVKKILIIPENFTRNYYYFENILALKNIIQACSIEVHFGSPFIQERQTYHVSEDIDIFPIFRIERSVFLEDSWHPDIILLNTDLTSGMIEILKDINQPIVPNPEYGWYIRRKFNHFSVYNSLNKKFCQDFNLDPWLLSTYIDKCTLVDFRNKIGLDSLATSVESLLEKIREKYKEYSIKESPYVFIKADNGTFGMGIMVAKSGEDIININKKKRHSMHAIKEGVRNNELIIQEGVPTIHQSEISPYENIAYLINGQIISFIRRQNPSSNHLMNLNSPQAIFTCDNNLSYNTEALVAELALLASSYE